MNVTELPFNQLVGIASSSQEGSLLMLPADPRYHNHLGTVHAGALMTLAEASSGALLLGKYGTLGFEVVPVVRRMETKFRKPAQGAVHSKASISSEQDAQFVAALTTKGRALVEVGVDLHDEHGTHALSATVEWFVAKR